MGDRSTSNLLGKPTFTQRPAQNNSHERTLAHHPSLPALSPGERLVSRRSSYSSMRDRQKLVHIKSLPTIESGDRTTPSCRTSQTFTKFKGGDKIASQCPFLPPIDPWSLNERTASRRPSQSSINYKPSHQNFSEPTTKEKEGLHPLSETTTIHENSSYSKKIGIIKEEDESNKCLSCSECKVTFTSQMDIEDHLHYAHKRLDEMDLVGIRLDENLVIKEGMRCPLCQEKMPGSKEELITQWFVDHIERSHFLCFDCQQWFSTEEELMDHEWGHHRKSGYSCAICRVEILVESEPKSHNGSGNCTEPVNQERCFYCAEDLAKHWAQFHQKDCYACRQRFNSVAELRRHVQMSAIHHPTHYECRNCHRQFTTLSRLVQHLESSMDPKCYVDFNQTQSFSELAYLLKKNALTIQLRPYSSEDSDTPESCSEEDWQDTRQS